MMNRVILVGRITKDPELKYTQTSVPFVNFTIAVNRTYVDQSGERQTDFINCIVWRKQAENLARYINKGALIGVEGKIQTRTYEVNNETRYVTEVLGDSVTFLETKTENESKFSNPKPEEDFDAGLDFPAEDDLPF